jgi:NAD(P)H-dependent FMN reductase
MSQLRITGIAGNLARPSKTRVLVEAVLREAEARGVGRGEVFDIVDAGPELGATLPLSLYAVDADFPRTGEIAEPIRTRIARAVEQLRPGYFSFPTRQELGPMQKVA